MQASSSIIRDLINAVAVLDEQPPEDAQPIISGDKKLSHCRSCGYSDPAPSEPKNHNDFYMITSFCPNCGYEEEKHPKDLRMIETILEADDQPPEDLQQKLVQKMFLAVFSWPIKGQFQRKAYGTYPIIKIYKNLLQMKSPAFILSLKKYAAEGKDQTAILTQFVTTLLADPYVDLSTKNKDIVIIGRDERSLDAGMKQYQKILNTKVRESTKNQWHIRQL